MAYPVISIVIATFNSEKTLKLTLESIKKQSYPKNKIEVLIIDGGSTDKTLGIVKLYKSKVIKNPKTELIYAKQIGYSKATGKYAIFLDSDEVFENRDSLKLKYQAMKKDVRVRAVMLSGYKSPVNYSEINNYINEFGDPFSFFIYRESKGDLFFVKDFSKKYKQYIKFNSKQFVIFDFSKLDLLPLLELWAGGSMMDIEFCRAKFPELRKNPDLIAQIFYLLNKEGSLVALTKNDNTIHYSSDSISRYLKKIKSRVENNIFHTPMGKGGFVGREEYQNLGFRLKKYLFIPYAFSLIFPFLDALVLAVTRKKLIYLIHLPLTIYTAIIILYYFVLKSFGAKPKIKTYGR